MPDEFITVARAVRPQGRRGELAAELHTDFPERFAQRKRLYALDEQGRRRELQVEAAWMHKGRVVLKFAGVESISDAQALVGCELQIRREERAELEPGSAYVSDLLGCAVWEVSGEPREIGRIEEVQSGAGDAPLLVVRQGKQEYLLPFAQEFVRRLDIEGKRLEMSLPEGMLELDAPLTAEEKRAMERGE